MMEKLSVVEGIAKQRYLRVSPRKLHKLAKQFVGKRVDEALSMLEHFPGKRTTILYKAIKSAAANARQKVAPDPLPDEELYIHQLKVDRALILKRWEFRARGRADIRRTRWSHLTVKVSNEEPGT